MTKLRSPLIVLSRILLLVAAGPPLLLGRLSCSSLHDPTGGLVAAFTASSSTTTATAAARRGSSSRAFVGQPQPQRPSRKRLLSLERLNAVKLEGRTVQGDVVPLNNFVLVRLAAAQEQTDGGILLTGKAKVVKTQGLVVAVGPGKTHPDSGLLVSVPVSPGEGVVYGKYDGTEILYNDAKHTLIRDDDVLVKFANGDGVELTIDNVEVIRDNVLVRVDTSEKTTEGGILIAKTSSADKRPSTGVVLKVGPGRTASNGDLMPMEVAVGDMIKFREFAGNEVEIEGQEYCVVKMVDILAKF